MGWPHRLYGGAVQRAVLDRLAHVGRLDSAATVEVRTGPRHLEDARIGTRAQAQPVDCKFEQPLARGLDLTVAMQLARAHLRVAEDSCAGEALELHPAGAVDALADRRR